MPEQNPTWQQPQEIAPVVRAFPAHVIGTLLPDLPDIPATYDQRKHWTAFATALAIDNWDGHDPALIKRDDVDADLAWTHITTVLGSFQPRFEHKVAGVAWLLSLWFRDVVPRSQIEDDPEEATA